MFGIGIIGCGRIAQVRHIPEYAANPDAKLVGFFNPSRERSEEMSKQYGGKVYASVEEMLADPEIHAVSVCSTNAAHAQQTIAALNAGKHVLCEKPMAATVEDCEAMVKAAEENGKYLMIAQNQRLEKAHATAKKLIREMWEKDHDPAKRVEREGLSQINDEDTVRSFVISAIEKSAKAVEDYKKGKESAAKSIIGRAMGESRGRANPAVVARLVCEELDSRN